MADSDLMELEPSRENVAELSNLLEQNPYNYDAHVKRINVSRLFQIQDCREYRREFHQYFPLTVGNCH
jgi:hypothetical protein